MTGLEIKRILLLQAAARLGPMAGTRVLASLVEPMGVLTGRE